ncbi:MULTISPECIES: hypothetical protein [unclassified Afipia]|uniref:hypothetical protein n=1 Tax=Afipia sp. NBIMC_P1-C3 TaxID=1320554 RepID=UPI000464462A|nr:MAG: hypothetical protein CBB64_09480 [Afipia sp. TMED4]
MFKPIFPAIAIAAALGFMSAMSPASAMQLSPQQNELYTSVSINPPSASEMTVCYGFVCRRRAILDFSAADRKALAQILASGKANAAAERAAIQKAVVWFDKRMGPEIGTSTRVARADIRNRADANNYDCWDSTRNVSSLLLVLQEWGLFKHHTVGNPRYRGNLFTMQLPHNTAVIVEKESRIEWSVDMWTTKYLQPPDVMLVEQWLKED